MLELRTFMQVWADLDSLKAELSNFFCEGIVSVHEAIILAASSSSDWNTCKLQYFWPATRAGVTKLRPGAQIRPSKPFGKAQN